MKSRTLLVSAVAVIALGVVVWMALRPSNDEKVLAFIGGIPTIQSADTDVACEVALDKYRSIRGALFYKFSSNPSLTTLIDVSAARASSDIVVHEVASETDLLSFPDWFAPWTHEDASYQMTSQKHDITAWFYDDGTILVVFLTPSKTERVIPVN